MAFTFPAPGSFGSYVELASEQSQQGSICASHSRRSSATRACKSCWSSQARPAARSTCRYAGCWSGCEVWEGPNAGILLARLRAWGIRTTASQVVGTSSLGAFVYQDVVNAATCRNAADFFGETVQFYARQITKKPLFGKADVQKTTVFVGFDWHLSWKLWPCSGLIIYIETTENTRYDYFSGFYVSIYFVGTRRPHWLKIVVFRFGQILWVGFVWHVFKIFEMLMIPPKPFGALASRGYHGYPSVCPATAGTGGVVERKSFGRLVKPDGCLHLAKAESLIKGSSLRGKQLREKFAEIILTFFVGDDTADGKARFLTKRLFKDTSW